MGLIIFIAIWIVCGYFAYHIIVAYFNTEFKDILHIPGQKEQTESLAIFMFFAGPIGLLVAWPASGFCKHGWRLK